MSALWRADLADDLAWRYEYESRAWGYAALRWLLVDPGAAAGVGEETSVSDAEVGMADVAWLRTATGELADAARQASRPRLRRARRALVERLSANADPLLRGQCDGRWDGQVSRELLAATAEATLLVGALSYACWPRAALAQAYFIQALALASACGDRGQGAAILSAMSNQAAFCGQLDEERNLLKTALKGGAVNDQRITERLRADPLRLRRVVGTGLAVCAASHRLGKLRGRLVRTGNEPNTGAEADHRGGAREVQPGNRRFTCPAHLGAINGRYQGVSDFLGEEQPRHVNAEARSGDYVVRINGLLPWTVEVQPHSAAVRFSGHKLVAGQQVEYALNAVAE
ncbi:MAG: hypothetical protein ACRDL8_04590, partial [Solirubrobacteraceae bacterium]